MAPSLTEFSRTLTAHGLDPGEQAVIVVLICLWVVLVAFKPKRRGASWLSVIPAAGSAERLALEEIPLMIAVICVVILAAVGVEFILEKLCRWWGLRKWEDRRARMQRALGIPKVRSLSATWKREKDREEVSAEDGLWRESQRRPLRWGKR